MESGGRAGTLGVVPCGARKEKLKIEHHQRMRKARAQARLETIARERQKRLIQAPRVGVMAYSRAGEIEVGSFRHVHPVAGKACMLSLQEETVEGGPRVSVSA